MISDSARIYPNVDLGENSVVGDFVVIGRPPRAAEAGELKTVIGDNAVIRSHTVIYAGNKIGRRLETGHAAKIRERNEIGDEVSIGTNSVVEHHVKIEDGVRIHSQAFVPEHTVLREQAWIGPNAVLTNARYPNRPDTKENLEGPVVGKNAVVGANATILPGVEIGEEALIGAGAVVSQDCVEAGSVVAGNPADELT